MSQRTQMRLHAITGSLSAIHTESLASVAAEPAAIGADHLLDILGEVAGSIKRIHGAASFTEQAAGVFTHATASFSGKLDVAGMLDVDGAFDAAGAANLQSTLTVGGAVDINAAADIQGALNLQSSLTVAGASDLNGALDVQGAVVMQSTLVVTGAADFLSTVDITGAVQMDSSLALAGNADFNGNLDVSGSSDLHGAVKAWGTLEVDGEATLASAIVEDLTNGRVALVGAAGALIDDAQITHSAGQLTVSGSTFSKDVSIVRDLSVGRDMSAVSGSFSGDLTIAGDLVVNGTTVTVNTTELLVEDNMVVINKNESGTGVTAGTAGIEIERGSADNAIVQWQESSDKFELKVGAAYADLKIDDLEAVDGTFSGDISAVNAGLTGDLTAVSGSFSGDVDVAGDLDVDGDLTVGSIKIDGDTATRLYIVDADGSMKDEVKLRFDGSELLVDAHLEVSGAADLKSTLAVASDADLNGNLDVALASDLHGAVHAYSTLLLDGAADLKSILWVTGAADFLSTMDIVGAVQMDSTLSVDGQATFSAAINLDQAADQSILKTGGDLYMSASADLRLQAGGDVKLADQYRAASTWSDAEGIKLAASAAEWSNFKATFGGEVSLLAALTGGGSGGKFKAEIAATSAFVTASAMADVAGGADFASKWASIVEPKIAKVDVFVNGQLMVSGSGMDYNVAANGDITFGFDLVSDDIVMALVR